MVKTATKPELTRDLKLSDRSCSGRLSVISHPSSPKFQNASLFSVSLAAALRSDGYSVIPVQDGQEALDEATHTQFDLVLLDLNMPVKSGWDTFERLTTENPLLPVIVITARPNQLFTALGAGVGALLEKPLDIPTLLKTVNALLTESAEVRLARVTGQPSPFFYRPTESRESPPSALRWGINE